MKGKSLIFMGCILFGLLAVSMNNLWLIQMTPAMLDTGRPLVRASSPLVINGNADFSLFSGNGTASNPYIIEGLNFSGFPLQCIRIHHTTAYFTLRHCVFFNVSLAIELFNVTHGYLFNNEIRNSSGCIDIEFSSYIELENNTVLFGITALSLSYSANCTILGNNLSYSEKGLALFSTDNNSFYGNSITHNKMLGVELSLSDNNTFRGNTFQCNSGTDWSETECSGNRFEGNILKSCGPESPLDIYFIVIGIVAGGATAVIGVRVLYHRRASHHDTLGSKKRKRTKGGYL